jgi:hypothetical protein
LAPLSPCGPSLILGVELLLDAFFCSLGLRQVFRRGTNGSNPVPSSRESNANLSFRGEPRRSLGACGAAREGRRSSDRSARRGAPTPFAVSRLSSIQVRYLTSATSSGRTQCTRLKVSGELLRQTSLAHCKTCSPEQCANSSCHLKTQWQSCHPPVLEELP